MWLSDVSVKRPVAALVLSMLLCVFGVVSFTKLAVREMPDIESLWYRFPPVIKRFGHHH